MNKDDEIKNDWQYLDMKRDTKKHVGDTAQRHYRRFPLDMSKHYKELEKPGAYVDYISDEILTSDNPWKNESKNMNKKLIRLTESDLHKIVKESVNRILNEIGDTAKGQYMLGRLQGRQMGNGNRQQAMNTQNYANKQLGSRTPQNFQTYDAAETANQMGYNDERNPQRSQDMMTNGGSIGNYQANVRNNYLRGVSKF